ncbi:MAG: cation:proton antiporter [Elusimicrobia bacterium]|nr:cation:proton antiporter [Elusimicrobiota bacterium]
MDTSLVIIFIGGLVFLAHLLSALFEKTQVPDVLPLVFLGLLVGPILHLITPEDLGKVGGVFAVITLIILLFQSGLDLDPAALIWSMASGTMLTITSFAASAVVMTLIAPVILGLTFAEGLMLGAILGGTSSAIVIPMVGRLGFQPRSRTALLLESTLSDVLCIVVTLAILQALSAENQSVNPGKMLGRILAAFLLASAIGAAAAVFWSTILEKVRNLENSLFTTPAFVFIVYGLSELLGYSGAISSLAFGIVLGNASRLNLPLLPALKVVKLNETERAVFAEIVFLLKTFFFLYIGLSIKLNNALLVFVGLAVTLLLLVLRAPVVYLSMGRSTPRLDASLAAVMIPKGLAAAVLASLPLRAGFASGTVIQDVTYAVILFSIIATATMTLLLRKGFLEKPYVWFFSKNVGEGNA